MEKTDFEVQKKDGLIDEDDLTLNNHDDSSTELWLLQWPLNQAPEIDGQEITLKLDNNNGELGRLQSSTGKTYEMFSLKSHDPEEIIILPSASDSKIVGKISRHVSLIHYPEASELQKQDKVSAKLIAQRSNATSLTNSARPTQTIKTTTMSRKRNSNTSTITRSQSPSSSSKRTKRTLVDEPTVERKKSKNKNKTTES